MGDVEKGERILRQHLKAMGATFCMFFQISIGVSPGPVQTELRQELCLCKVDRRLRAPCGLGCIGLSDGQHR